MLKGLILIITTNKEKLTAVVKELYEIIFGSGVYTGVYIAQNYQIDKVEDPKALLEKLKLKIEEYTGKKP